MRRFLLLGLTLSGPGLLVGCTGTGVFFDHTFQAFGKNPNSPAGNSQTMMRLRGGELSTDVVPILPEPGNVWPGPQPPDPTLDELARQQAEAAKNSQGQMSGQNGGQNAGQNAGQNQAPGRRPRGSSTPPQASPAARAADQSLPPPNVPPVAPPRSPQGPIVQTPDGPSVDVGRTGSERGYRQLQSPNPSGTGILVPNGNGTSTLINPDGGIQTVPTRP